MGPLANFKIPKGAPKKVNELKWIDDVEQHRRGKKEGLRANNFDGDLLKQKEIIKVEIHHRKTHVDVVNSLRKRSFSL